MRYSLTLAFFSFFIAGLIPCGNAQVISTIAGVGSYGFSGDGGPATAAQVKYIWHIAADGAGNIYFTDNVDARVRKIDPAGTITTIAGNGIVAYSGDGGPATAAQLMGPSGIAADAAGNVYVADNINHRIRMISTAGVISTIAGNGTAGYSGDGGLAPAAMLNSPYAIATDMSGNIYFSDVANNRVRKIDASGIISTVAGDGIGGFSGDGGPATAAHLLSPASIALDVLGNLYIGDVNNNRIRMVSAGGTITTIAGNGTAGFSGDGGPATAAQINQPLGLVVDGIGNVIVSDQFNHRIRSVSPAGVITTIAGNGVPAFGGDGGPATAAEISLPFGVALDINGNLFIADRDNYRLRMINNLNGFPSFASGVADSIAVCENAAATPVNTLLVVGDADTGQTLTWTLFSGAAHGTAVISYSAATTAGAITPSGLTYTPNPGYSGYDTFKVRVDDGISIDTITISVRVKPLPGTGTISGPSIVCIGVPVTMTNSVPGGVWSAGIGNATISTSGIVNGITYGADTIYYTVTVDGCAAATSKAIDIYTIVDSVAGPDAVCFGLAVLLTGIPPGGTWSSANGVTTVVGGLVTGITPGVDTITYTVVNPCSISTFQKPITVNAMIAPSVMITARPSAYIVPGQSDTLTAVITSGVGIAYSYQWQLNGTDIPGATDSVYISSTFAHHDSVSCIVTNGPCAAGTFSWIYIVYVNGIDDQVLADAEISVSPNPSSGVLTVNGIFPSDDERVTITVTDITGRALYEEQAQVKSRVMKKQMDMSGLGNGMYLLHITTKYGQKVVKFAIQ